VLVQGAEGSVDEGSNDSPRHLLLRLRALGVTVLLQRQAEGMTDHHRERGNPVGLTVGSSG
jgi:hypothetical protein